MCDFFDNFEDDFDEGEFMDDDQFEDSFEEDLETDESLADDTGFDDEPDRAESQDGGFTAKDAFVLGGAIGWAYDEGLKDEQIKQRKKRSKQNIKDN